MAASQQEFRKVHALAGELEEQEERMKLDSARDSAEGKLGSLVQTGASGRLEQLGDSLEALQAKSKADHLRFEGGEDISRSITQQPFKHVETEIDDERARLSQVAYKFDHPTVPGSLLQDGEEVAEAGPFTRKPEDTFGSPDYKGPSSANLEAILKRDDLREKANFAKLNKEYASKTHAQPSSFVQAIEWHDNGSFNEFTDEVTDVAVQTDRRLAEVRSTEDAYTADQVEKLHNDEVYRPLPVALTSTTAVPASFLETDARSHVDYAESSERQLEEPESATPAQRRMDATDAAWLRALTSPRNYKKEEEVDEQYAGKGAASSFAEAPRATQLALAPKWPTLKEPAIDAPFDSPDYKGPSSANLKALLKGDVAEAATKRRELEAEFAKRFPGVAKVQPSSFVQEAQWSIGNDSKALDAFTDKLQRMTDRTNDKLKDIRMQDKAYASDEEKLFNGRERAAEEYEQQHSTTSLLETDVSPAAAKASADQYASMLSELRTKVRVEEGALAGDISNLGAVTPELVAPGVGAEARALAQSSFLQTGDDTMSESVWKERMADLNKHTSWAQLKAEAEQTKERTQIFAPSSFAQVSGRVQATTEEMMAQLAQKEKAEEAATNAEIDSFTRQTNAEIEQLRVPHTTIAAALARAKAGASSFVETAGFDDLEAKLRHLQALQGQHLNELAKAQRR